MDSKTFYRKYRPQTFAELDLADIRSSLTQVFASGRFPQALLFSGPKGTGKTSAARLVAKAVNCLDLREGEPCNRCANCRAISAGTDLDLLEIDAASNRGIDDIRELREKINLSPVKNRYKVYIIDEVHMLTNEAFNALLKTLEEPPPHAVFVLCTTDPQKLPETVISRCLRFNFSKASQSEIIRSLTKVIKTEKLRVEEGVLAAIAAGCDGSFRDAQKFLEQLSLQCPQITLVSAQKFLGQSEGTNPARLIELLKLKKTQKALQEVARLVDIGADLNDYLLRLLNFLRQDLIKNLDLIKFFLPLAAQIKISPIASLPFEIAVVDYCQAVSRPSVFPLAPPLNSLKPPIFSSSELPAGFWNNLLAAVHPQNHSVEGLLRSARPLELADGCLTLEVFYKFHQEQLTTAKCRDIVEKAAAQLLGHSIKVKCLLGKRSLVKSPKPDIIEVAKEIFK
ncbi:MAG: DNA polymerase III subunit gamma/tau [Candidatus Shapirobacteria bacterium]